jgi:hypothetical protein
LIGIGIITNRNICIVWLTKFDEHALHAPGQPFFAVFSVECECHYYLKKSIRLLRAPNDLHHLEHLCE